MKNQILEEINHRLAASDDEIRTLQKQITNLSQPTCTDKDLIQIKMLVSKFPITNLKNAQYLHATQLQVASKPVRTTRTRKESTKTTRQIYSTTPHCCSKPSKQSFDTANQRFSKLAAAHEFFSDFISDSN